MKKAFFDGCLSGSRVGARGRAGWAGGWGLRVGAALIFMVGLPESGWAQTTTLNVLDFGAKGDAIQTTAATTLNSTSVTLQASNQLSSADVGKVIELFGVGKATSATNNQDLVATIVGVTGRAKVTISVPAGLSSNAVNCTIGTQNAQAFQNCVNACVGTNTDILVPAGRYLLIPPAVLNPAFTMNSASVISPAVILQKGGIRFLGADPASSMLLGNGAWVLKGAYVERGAIFACTGPVTNNNAPLVIQNLTMDGGVQVGNQGLVANPASVVDGSGWDITHTAMVDTGQAPLHAWKRFVNCRITHWRGEMVKSVVGNMDGLVQVTNCAFLDGDASGFNFNFTHQISGCVFSNLFMAIEFYEGYMQSNSVFENSTVTNVVNGMVLVGALTNRVQPGYTISSNIIGASQCGVLFSPVQNLTVAGNQFFGGEIGVGSDNYAYQGTAINSNILVQQNTFTGTSYPLNIASSGQDRVVNMTWQNNTARGCARFANGDGWSTNVVFIGNSSLPLNGQQGRLWSSSLAGQYFIDDESNQFPSNQVNMLSYRPTNLVSYANGMRQFIASDSPNCAAVLDTSHPDQMPAGAVMNLSYSSQYPAVLYLSPQVSAGNSLRLNPGDSVKCQWTNGQWSVVSSGDLPPPKNLRLLNMGH